MPQESPLSGSPHHLCRGVAHAGTSLCMWEAVLRQEAASGPEEGWAACISAWLDEARPEGKDACWLKDKYSSSVQPSGGDNSAPEHGHASAILFAQPKQPLPPRCASLPPALREQSPSGRGAQPQMPAPHCLRPGLPVPAQPGCIAAVLIGALSRISLRFRTAALQIYPSLAQ